MSLHKLFSFCPFDCGFHPEAGVTWGRWREKKKSSFFAYDLGCNIQISSQGQVARYAVTCENTKPSSICMAFFFLSVAQVGVYFCHLLDGVLRQMYAG